MAVQRTLPAKQITLNMALAVDSISFDAVRVALNLVANMQRLEMTARFFIQRLEQSGISEQRRKTVSVYLIDKRRRGQQIPPVGIPNHTWFCVLDIDGMDALVDTRHYCDTATATPAKAKKMAALIENWTPPDGWCNGNDRDWHEKMKGYICDFLRKCNGFRVM